MCLFDCVPFVLFRYTNICFTPNNSDLTELITTEAFNCPAFTIAAGTPGTHVGYYKVNVSKEGYTPILATLYDMGHPAAYSVDVGLYNNEVYFYIYRATNSAYSYGAGEIRAIVTYSKILA